MTVFALKDGQPFRWKKAFSDADDESVKRQIHDLAKYLLQTYRGTGKTFILQNWEGDWTARVGFSTRAEDGPKTDVFERMTRWMNARQEGVDQARTEVGETDVRIYHACEVNLVAIAMKGRPMVTNSVVPNTHCDLYAYSAYDTIKLAARKPDRARKRFLAALDYLAAKAPDSPPFGQHNVYIGEFGHPEVPNLDEPELSTEKAMRVIRMTTEAALDWGCPYVVYWQVYDNEALVEKRRSDNSQVRGFYLIKPDGTHAPAWDYFTSLLTGK